MHSRYAEIARQWINTAHHRNYWTCAPRICERFRPDELTFYYRDYSPKARWLGPVNNCGIPLVEATDGHTFCHPLMLAQKALGHWNLWQQSDGIEREHLDRFLSLASWLCKSQERGGGWPIESLRKPTYRVPYSAMAQGQIASVLVRAFTATSAESYLDAARSGIRLMLMPIESGGTARKITEGLLLEEYVIKKPNGVFNGWINAVFGIRDYLVVEFTYDVSVALAETLCALIACLPKYDLGFWSSYDLNGNVASPYYQRVHITQLQALESAVPESKERFRIFRQRLDAYSRSRVCQIRAVANKAVQKALQPPATVLKEPTRSDATHASANIG